MKQIKLLKAVPPWMMIGAMAIFFPVVAFLSIENVHRQKQNSIHLLLEKGAALIRCFEAGTRTGMMGLSSGRHGGGFKLQRLLTETAQLEDIIYIMITGIEGKILIHSNPKQKGMIYGNKLNLKEVLLSSKEKWRIVEDQDGRKIFEVFRKFSPIRSPMGLNNFCMMMDINPNETLQTTAPAQIIFIGLDMRSIEESRKADIRQTLIMGLIMLLIGFTGIILLFLTQSYHSTRASLSRIKAFSDTLVESMPIGLISTNDKKKLTFINKVAALMLNISSHDIIGQDAEDVLPKQLWEQLEHPDIRNCVIEKEINCSLGDDKEIPMEITASVMQDDSKHLFGYILMFKDLSEVHSLRKEIARNQRLVAAGSLAAGVAHEIRNPLSSIKGFATYFKERYHQIPEDLDIANIMI